MFLMKSLLTDCLMRSSRVEKYRLTENKNEIVINVYKHELPFKLNGYR